MQKTAISVQFGAGSCCVAVAFAECKLRREKEETLLRKDLAKSNTNTRAPVTWRFSYIPRAGRGRGGRGAPREQGGGGGGGRGGGVRGRIWVSSAISLRAPYALSGTDIPCGAVCLRANYAMSGTQIAYCAIGLRLLCDVRTALPSLHCRYRLLSSYAHPTKCPGLRSRSTLPIQNAPYYHSAACYYL
eukprot:1344496-Rhodomonas_salina.1